MSIIYHMGVPLLPKCGEGQKHVSEAIISINTERTRRARNSWWATVKVRLWEQTREVSGTSNIRFHNMHMVLFYVLISLWFSWHVLEPDSLKCKNRNHLSSFLLTTPQDLISEVFLCVKSYVVAIWNCFWRIFFFNCSAVFWFLAFIAWTKHEWILLKWTPKKY